MTSRKYAFPTRPEPVEVDPQRAAVIVVDMQNAFATKGGMFDLSGLDISGAKDVTEMLKDVLDHARQAGIKVVYLQMGYDAGFTNSGGPESPNAHKELALLYQIKENLKLTDTMAQALMNNARSCKLRNETLENLLEKYRNCKSINKEDRNKLYGQLSEALAQSDL